VAASTPVTPTLGDLDPRLEPVHAQMRGFTEWTGADEVNIGSHIDDGLTW
jgi:hypothetical protein